MNESESATSADPVPYISVVLVFHTRLNFLSLALTSILEQTLPGDQFEVLVVGPKRPEGLVDRPSSPLVRFVECAEAELGNKIAAGIRRSQGEVIAFLEDDDLFEPDKLSFVRDAFLSDSNLAYLQNGYRTIDERGRWISRKGPDERAMERWARRGKVLISGRPTDSELRQFSHIPAGFNNSSIAVRRRLVRPHLPLLESVDTLVDVTLLYGALVQRCHLCLDPRPLTRLRKHASSNSDPRSTSELDQLSRLRAFSQAARSRRRLLLEFVRENGSPAVVRAIEGQWAINEIFLNLRDSRYRFSDRARSLLNGLRRVRTFEEQNYILAIPLAALVILTGRFGPRLYIRVRRRFYLQTQ